MLQQRGTAPKNTHAYLCNSEQQLHSQNIQLKHTHLMSMLVFFMLGWMRVRITGRPPSTRRTTGRVTVPPCASFTVSQLQPHPRISTPHAACVSTAVRMHSMHSENTVGKNIKTGLRLIELSAVPLHLSVLQCKGSAVQVQNLKEQCPSPNKAHLGSNF